MNLGRVGMDRVLFGPSWHGPSWFWSELSVIPQSLVATSVDVTVYLLRLNSLILMMKRTNVAYRNRPVTMPWLTHLGLVLEVPDSMPANGEEMLVSEHAFSPAFPTTLVSFAGIALDKCTGPHSPVCNVSDK